MEYIEATEILNRVERALTMLSCVNMLSVEDIIRFTNGVKDVEESYKKAVSYLIENHADYILKKHWDKIAPYMDKFSKRSNKALQDAMKNGNHELEDAVIDSQCEVGTKIHHVILAIHGYLASCRYTTVEGRQGAQQVKGAQSTTGGGIGQQEAVKEPQQSTGIVIPDSLQEYKDQLFTDRANKYFPIALANGLIEQTSQGYKKHSGISKALLAYFLQRVYIVDGAVFPEKALDQLFGESYLKQAVYVFSGNKNGDGKPRQYQKVDAIFDEA